MRIPSNNVFQQELSNIDAQYQKLTKLSQQQVTGKKLIYSSDDPVLANSIKSTDNFIANLVMYQNNQILAKNRSQQIDSTMAMAADSMSKIHELLLRATNDTQGDDERAIFAKDLQNYLSDMVRVANTQDGSGNYIFAGFNVNAQPYVQKNGEYIYQGTDDTTSIDIGQNTQAVYNESGLAIFGAILTGNGTFTITAADGNVGAVYSSPGSVIDNAAYVEDTYTLTFVTNGAGQLAYQIVGSASGQVVPAPPATVPGDAPQYVSNADITFNGMSFNIAGQPSVGDTFVVAPSTKENLFNTLQQLVTTLNMKTNNDPVAKANFHQDLSQLIASFEQAQHHLQVYQSSVGTREALIQDQISNAQSQLDEQTTISSSLSDAPLEQVISNIEQQMIGLKVTQNIYLKIQQAVFEMLQS